MAELFYAGAVQLGDVHSAWPFQKQAELSITDYLTSAFPITRESSKAFRYDPQLGVAYAQEILVPYDQRIKDGVDTSTVKDFDKFLLGKESTYWTVTQFDAGNHFLQNFRDKAGFGYQLIDVKWKGTGSPTGNIFEAKTLPPSDKKALNCQGFNFIYNKSKTTWQSPDDANGVDLYWRIGDDWYGVQFTQEGSAIVVWTDENYEATPNVEWHHVGVLAKSSLAQHALTGNNARIRSSEFVSIRVRALSDQLVIDIGGNASPFVTPIIAPKTDPLDTSPRATVVSPTITQVFFDATQFSHLSYGLHPLCFATEASMRSNPQQIAEVPDESTPIYYIVGLPSGSAVVDSGDMLNPDFPDTSIISVTTVAETEQTAAPQYDLLLKNKVDGSYATREYSHTTAVITKITLRVPGIVIQYNAQPTLIPFGVGAAKPVCMAQNSVVFNPASMTMERKCSVTFNNWEGTDDFSAVTGVSCSGNVAMALDMGYDGKGTARRYTGIVETFRWSSPGGGKNYLTLLGTDVMTQLADCYIFCPPDLDGMNQYYAMAVLASFAGVSRDQLGFASLIPDDPFQATDNDPDPFFLPRGIGMTPWTPRNRSMPVLELMQSIQKLAGFLLYADEFNVLQYLEWIPSDPLQPKRVFTYADTGYDGANLDAIWSLTGESSTRETRNQIVIVGIDANKPGWDVLVVKREDKDSIDAPPSQQPRNYCGKKKPLVWMDSRFADLPFATKSADRLYRTLRIPSYTVNFTTHLQNDLFPLDVIWVNDPKTGTFGIPFYIMGIQEQASVIGGSITQQSTISARYLTF